VPDVLDDGAIPGSELDAPPIERLPWLTPRRLMLFVIGWILLFALISVFVSNPFQSESNAGAGPDYWHVMFLHGLLISMVGLGALVPADTTVPQAPAPSS
jgi:hypothetical protein